MIRAAPLILRKKSRLRNRKTVCRGTRRFIKLSSDRIAGQMRGRFETSGIENLNPAQAGLRFG